MIVDTSALMAILLAEPESPRFAALMANEETAISAGNLLEAHIVAGIRGSELRTGLEMLLTGSETTILPTDERQARVGSDAYTRYGRGSGHKAQLNYGDCFSYALAVCCGEPLLCKGDNFVHTDVRLAT